MKETATTSESPANISPSERNYILRDGSALYRDAIDPRNGGIYCVGELRGSRLVEGERIDKNSGQRVKAYRLMVNIETLDESAESIKLEFNGWDKEIPKIPFKKGEKVILRVVDNYKGTWYFDAVARYQLSPAGQK